MKKILIILSLMIFSSNLIFAENEDEKNNIQVWFSAYVGTFILNEKPENETNFLETGYIFNFQLNNHLFKLGYLRADNDPWSLFGESDDEYPYEKLKRLSLSYHHVILNFKLFQISLGIGLNRTSYQKIYYKNHNPEEKTAFGFSLEGEAMIKIFIFSSGIYAYYNQNSLKTHAGYGAVLSFGWF